MAAMSPFQIFGLEPRFALDIQGLEKKYFEIQKRIHPDKFANASAAEKRVAEQWSTLVNDAYASLRDPVRRAKLLCEAEGFPVDENSSLGIDEDFLMDQLMRREEIEEAKGASDAARLSELKADIGREFQQLVDGISAALDEEKNPRLASELVRKLMFLKRQLEDLK